MQEPTNQPAGVFASLRRLLQTVLAIVQNRLELVLVEAQEERLQFFETLLLAGTVIVLGAITAGTVIFTLVALCIHAERFDLLIGLVLVCLLATGVAFWRLRRRLKTWVPFSATLAELKKDKACLEQKP
ncbi:MAG TPA: phage holin family protein [Verrucomicrobiae bacterium]